MSLPSSRRTLAYKPALAWFAAIGSLWVFVLILLGAFTTTIHAGMIFPDWPLSDGSLNPHGWLHNIDEFAEHSHRLSAELMSIITIAIALWVWVTEARAWLRKLAGFAVALVIVQAVVGGLRVLLDPDPVVSMHTSVGQLFAMLHACLGQIYACVLFAIAISLSRSWFVPARPEAAKAAARLRRIGRVCCGLILLQLAIASVLRHYFAGLAIPTFPYATPARGLLPDAWNFGIGINFVHTRVMALAITIGLVTFAARIWRERYAAAGVKQAAAIMLGLLCLQIVLGVSIIWSHRDQGYTTAHVVVGALTLVVTFGITWWLHREAIEERAAKASTFKASTSNPPARA